MTTESPQACDFGGSIEEMDPSIGELDRGSPEAKDYEASYAPSARHHLLMDVCPERYIFRLSIRILTAHCCSSGFKF